MHYLSLRHCTANEDGDEEITIVRLAGLLEWSAMMLKSGTTNVGREKQLELFEIKCSMQANSAAKDRLK